MFNESTIIGNYNQLMFPKYKDKITIKAIPQCMYTSYNEFGNVYLYKFIVDGNVFTWKTSRGLNDQEYELKGSIKAHNEYKGIKQTELTRCRVIE